MANGPDGSQAPGKLISQLLLEDASLADIVEEFVHGLDARIDEMRGAYGAMNWAALVSLAHRLKGAGGSYGYPDVSAVALRIEHAIRQNCDDHFAAWMAELEALAAAARAGLENHT